MTEGLDLEVYKDIPGYKGILKVVLKSQIQLMVQQLAQHTGEESILLSASVSDGTFSHIASEFGKDFIRRHDEFRSKFLGFCLERYHKRKRDDKHPSAKRFASTSQLHRSKGQLGEASSKSSPLSFTGPPASVSRVPGLGSGSKHTVYMSPEDLGDSVRERTLEQPRSVREGTLEQPRKAVRDNNGSRIPCQIDVDLPPLIEGVGPQFLNVKKEVVGSEVTGAAGESIGFAGIQTVEERRKPAFETTSEGNTDVADTSYDYVYDQDRETEVSPLPWQPNGAFTANERQPTSKRKQSVPVRHRPEMNNDVSGFMDDEISSEIRLTNSPVNKESQKSKLSKKRYSPTSSLNNDTKKNSSKSGGDPSFGSASDITFGELSSTVWPGSSYIDADSSKSASFSGETDGKSASFSGEIDMYMNKNYMKTPQIDGLLVSRGEGRFEKLIKCDICSKVCRTSNMARHKKRYCLGANKGTGSPNANSSGTLGSRGDRLLGAQDYSQAELKYTPMEESRYTSLEESYTPMVESSYTASVESSYAATVEPKYTPSMEESRYVSSLDESAYAHMDDLEEMGSSGSS